MMDGVIDYSSYFVDLIDKQNVVINRLNELSNIVSNQQVVIDSLLHVQSLVGFFVTVIVPGAFIVAALWWFVKQFLSDWR